ncbi:MAG: alpha-amylase family glycosyl hydrolase [Saprospiraceae bacterium]
MKFSIFWLTLNAVVFLSCENRSNNTTKNKNRPTAEASFRKQAPDWFKDAVIYEVNIRQGTRKGTFTDFMPELNRLKQMGVDVIWLMPVFPISKIKRKGTLGSPYSVQDFRAINPDFGSMKDFDKLLQSAHALGMHVILDFVSNHTGWDHVWMKDHQDWYTKANDTIRHPTDKNGKNTDWYDVAELDFDNQDMCNEMIECMKFWVKEHDIDGYRMDMAELVPNNFWEKVRPELQSIKPILMITESEDNPEHFESCFETNYGWRIHHLMNDLAQGKGAVGDFDVIYKRFKADYPSDATQLLFVTNHDENTWKGSELQRMGRAKNAMAAFSFTFDGVPLLYTGQEFENRKKLAFFEKDNLDYKQLNYAHADFYKRLAALKHRNQALWNGLNGGAIVKIPVEDRKGVVYAFQRKKDADIVLSIFNFSPLPVRTRIIGNEAEGEYREVFSEKSYTIKENMPIQLPAWGFLIFEKINQ